ncbi:hypothetical protein [Flammeovirga sp. OC4]|uniref:hypothetical protein n=1 Tax=Flammeovirga sp. OC4 TaxID=1382345 RepID=UPI0005C69C1C|nr:hypothetical protein [Flammeovirga sp. OC4]
MKTLKYFFAFIFVALVSLNTTFADNEDEITKLRASVENADNWSTYADAAERCIELKTNLSEAYVWLETAIQMSPNARNFELRGDYLKLNGAKDMAIEAYRQAILKGMNDDSFDVEKVQKKLLKLVK